MKKCLVAFAAFVLFVGLSKNTSAQNIDLTILYGYTFADQFNAATGYGDVSDGGVLTGILSFAVNPNYDVELYYSRQNATFDFADYYYSFTEQIRNAPASVNYIQIGGCRNQALDPNGRALFFGGVNLGTVGIIPENSKYDDVWKFAAGLKTGVKYFVSERIGIRLQAQLQIPVLYTSGSIWVGTGGANVGMSAGSTITQFGFSGGLVFRLK